MSEDHIWKVAQSVGFDDYELRPMLEAFAALIQQAQEPVGDRYFSYSTDMGFEEFATQQEAIDCSNVQINGYREDAIRDNEWPDEVDSVCWGVILGRSKEIDTSNEDQESVDYKLYTTSPAAQDALTELADWHWSQAATLRKAASTSAMDKPEPVQSSLTRMADWHDAQKSLIRAALQDKAEGVPDAP